jgi:hypothetical protein
MKYKYRAIYIDDLKDGDIVDIPDGNLILNKHTTSEQGYIHDPDKPATITMLVPRPVEM